MFERSRIAIHCAPIVFFATALLLPAEARATCVWDTSGQWNVEQSNGFRVILRLQQKFGGEISGTAYERTIGTGNVSGTMLGDAFSISVYWPRNSIGRYYGNVRENGYIENGRTCDAINKNCANWHSTSPLKVTCKGS